MSALEIAAFAASAASVAIAVIAIWLSVHFYKMSTEQNKNSSDAAKDIASSVDKLEKLFEKLYEGTFTMVKDTVADMRKHVWGDQARLLGKITDQDHEDEKLKKIRASLGGELADIVKRQSTADQRLTEVSAELETLLDKAVEQTRQTQTEFYEERIKTNFMLFFMSMMEEGESTTGKEIRVSLSLSLADYGNGLRQLKKEGIVDWVGDLLSDSTAIVLKKLPPKWAEIAAEFRESQASKET